MARRRARNRKVRRIHVTYLLVKLHNPRQRIGVRRRKGWTFPLDGRYARRRIARRGNACRRTAVARPIRRSVCPHAHAYRTVGDTDDGKRPDAAGTRQTPRRKVRKRDVFDRKVLRRFAERERDHGRTVQRIGYARNRQRRRRIVQKVRAFIRADRHRIDKRIAIERLDILTQSEGERCLCVKGRKIAARRLYRVGAGAPRNARYANSHGAEPRAGNGKVRSVDAPNPLAERNLPSKRIRMRMGRNRIVPRNG